MTEQASDYADLVEVFTNAGLSVPPIPLALRPPTRARRRWMWSSRDDIDAVGMYAFAYPREVQNGPVSDYVAVSHAGHGSNSYGLNFHLVCGPLALFTQNGWGGVYMDSEKTDAAVARTFEQSARLIEELECVLKSGQAGSGERLVVKWSDFRGVCEHALVDHRTPEAVQWFRHDGQEAMFDAAVEVLAGLAG